MFQLSKFILPLTFLTLSLPLEVEAQSRRTTAERSEQAVGTDTVVKKKSAINRIIDYFDSSNKKELTTHPDFSVLGGPHYSSEKGLGLGLVVAGIYSTEPSDTVLPASNISLVGDIATKSFYMVGLRGAHVFPSNSRRINYSVSFESFATYFWGIGYAAGNNDGNKTKYRQLKFDISADMEWRLAKGLYLGPAVRFLHVNAKDLRNVEIWSSYPHAVSSIAAGGRLQYDLRDNLTAPTTGLLLEVTQLFYPRFIGNGDRSFSSTEIAANKYVRAWKNSVVAVRAHALFTYGHTPWCAMAYIGGNNMRGYYEGRYRNKNEFDLTVELRQHLFRRSGVVGWLGVASVFPKFKEIRFRELLPECGIGYRWEFKKNSNVRIDFGIGKHSTGFMFGLNEAF